MNKTDLISEVAKATGTKKSARTAVEAVLNAIGKALKKKDTVTLIGFGTFAVKNRAARVGRNPQTGGELQIPAKNVPVFRPGKDLKETVL